jgi:hypothetical protein
MRFSGKVAIVLFTGIAAVGLAIGQQPGGGRFGGGGFGGFGGGGLQDPSLLIQNPSVRKELSLTDEQAAKVPEAVLKGIAEVLTPEQMKRFNQIVLQRKGYRALSEAKVQMALHMTAEQKDTVKTVLADSDKERREVMQEAQGGGGGFQGIREKLTAINKEAQDKTMGVLNAKQKAAWQEMLGEEFKMEMPGFGGGGGGKGFKGKKKKNDP